MTASTTELKDDGRLQPMSVGRRLLRRPELGALGGTVFVFAFFIVTAGRSGMFSPLGIVNFTQIAAFVGILGVPVALLMIAGEFDLSVGSVIGFSSMTIAITAVQFGWPLWLSIVTAFVLAAAIGFVNGIIVVKTRLPSFIVTLAALYAFRGLTIGLTRLITGRTQVSGLKPLIEHDGLARLFSGVLFHDSFVFLASAGVMRARADGQPVVAGVPVSIVWWLALGVLASIVLTRMRFGNWIFATGGSEISARNMGVPVDWVKISLFIATALGATLVATLQSLDSGSADTARGDLKEFEAIISVVIGGCLLTGGFGTVIGPMFGALIFGAVQIGIFYTGLDSDWFRLFLGGLLLLAVLFNNFIRRRLLVT